MSNTNGNCILCGNECEVHADSLRDRLYYRCGTCGRYCITVSFARSTLKERSQMLYYMLHMSQRKKLTVFVDDASCYENDNDQIYVDKARLANLYPHDFGGRVDMILLNLGAKIQLPGDTAVFLAGEKAAPNYPMFFVNDTTASNASLLYKQVDAMLHILLEMGFITIVAPDIGTQTSYTFTAKGWEYLSKLQRNQERLPQAFVAMWFDDGMTSHLAGGRKADAVAYLRFDACPCL